MHTFDTPGPLAVTVDLPGADTRFVASERPDTVVEVSFDGTDPDRAHQPRVELVNGRLMITAPEPSGWGARWGLGFLSRGWAGGLRVDVALPAGSRITVDSRYGSVRAEGRLGECHVRTGYGEIRLDETGPVDLRSDSGDVVVDRVVGPAEIAAKSGSVHVRAVDGTATVTNHHGGIDIGEITGALRAAGTYGDLTVDRARADVSVRNAYGRVHIRELTGGVTTLTTTYGEIEVGLATGTAAWLDISSGTGTLHNHLDEHKSADGFDRTVTVHARTRDGDIVVRRT